jgi:hypothetical protein
MLVQTLRINLKIRKIIKSLNKTVNSKFHFINPCSTLHQEHRRCNNVFKIPNLFILCNYYAFMMRNKSKIVVIFVQVVNINKLFNIIYEFILYYYFYNS